VETWKIAAGETIGSLVFAEEGILLAMDHGLHVLDTRNGSTRFFADPKAGREDLVYNDAKTDRAGRYWVGTLDLGEGANGRLYRVLPDGSATIADDGFSICNGPAFSPDNRILYFSDSIGRRILSYDLDEQGALSGRRVFCTFAIEDGLPDGLTVDSAGNVWCALYDGGKVVCFDRYGCLKHTFALPAHYVTSLCFVGADLKTLFVTTGWDEARGGDGASGSVFMRRVDVPGLPEPIAGPWNCRGVQAAG